MKKINENEQWRLNGDYSKCRREKYCSTPCTHYKRRKSAREMEDSNYAYLSNSDGFTVFRYKNRVIRFKAPYSLEHYSSVKEWNHGYLVVMAKYRHNKEDEEEYIDLIPVLETLYIDPDEFLEPIKGVKIETNAEREKALERLYSDPKSEKKAAFARLEQLCRKGTVTDYDAELVFYRDEKYGR